MNDTMSFNYGDLVWAKMKGYCAWPGRIVEATDDLQKIRKTEKSTLVYFFGSHNYAWIDDKNVLPYLDHKEQMVKLGRPKSTFDKAILEIENYMSNPDGNEVIITPSRKKSIAKVRPSVASVEEPKEDENHVEEAEKKVVKDEDEVEEEEAIEAPKKPKTPAVKRSTQKKTPKATAVSAKKKKAPSEDIEDEVIPAKRQRQNNSSPAVRNSTSANNNNNIEMNSSQEISSSTIKKELFSTPVVPRPSRAARAIIDRPMDVFIKPDENDLDVATVSDTLKSKNITASKNKFGFIGLGIMGSGIVKNLLNSGHEVCVYNRTHEKTTKFKSVGAKVMLTPSDVIEFADITFSCVSDPKALKETIFGRFGVATPPTPTASTFRGKGFVEMTTIDADTSRDIESALSDIGMNYLEAQIHGTKAQAEEGKLIILAAGDKALFDSCQTCFEAMGKNSFFVGETGNATKMNLVIQTLTGITIAGLADSITLAERAGLSTETYMEIMSHTNLRSDLIMDKGLVMVDSRFTQVSLPLQHMQKDLRLALNMADNLNQPMPLTAIANEAYKNARRYGLSESDASAICYRARH